MASPNIRRVWSELSQAHHRESVDEVVSEAMTGSTSCPGRVPVDRAVLINGLAKPPHLVTKQERNKLISDYPLATFLDAGERNLYAYLYSYKLPLAPFKVVSTADKGPLFLPNFLEGSTS